jgi:hypothetical protein
MVEPDLWSIELVSLRLHFPNAIKKKFVLLEKPQLAWGNKKDPQPTVWSVKAWF